MRQHLTFEEKLAAKAARQAEVLARREARKAETRARNEAKKQAALQAKAAERESQRQAWKAEQQKHRDDFKATMSEQDWVDFQEAINEPSSKVLENGLQLVTNEWLHSVKQQFQSRGWLSQKQLQLLLKKVRRRRELATKAEAWPKLKEGDNVKLFCTVIKSEEIRGVYGMFFKITLDTHYGRRCNIKTGRREWHEVALQKQQAGKRVFVYAKIKWISPEAGSTFVLTSRGAKFGDLL